MATISGAVSGGFVNITGTGYTAGAKVRITAAFAATDAKRRFIEVYTTDADGSGNIAFAVPIKHTSGSIVVKALTLGTATVLATSTSQAV